MLTTSRYQLICRCYLFDRSICKESIKFKFNFLFKVHLPLIGRKWPGNFLFCIYHLLGQDSPSLKLYYLSLWLSLFQWKTLLVEKTVVVELGESQPCRLNCLNFNIKTSVVYFYQPTGVLQAGSAGFLLVKIIFWHLFAQKEKKHAKRQKNMKKLLNSGRQTNNGQLRGKHKYHLK